MPGGKMSFKNGVPSKSNFRFSADVEPFGIFGVPSLLCASPAVDTSAAATNANASFNDGLDLSDCLVAFANSCSTLSWQGWHILSGVTAKAWHLPALCP